MASVAKPGVDQFDVFALISKWSLRVEKGNKSETDWFGEQIHGVASRALAEIVRLAFTGHEKSAKNLHLILASNVSSFVQLCEQNPKLFEPIARKTTYWPALISCLNDSQRRNKKLQAMINLGLDSGINISGKQPDWESAEIEAASSLHGLMELYRQDYLPENIKHFRAQIRQINKMLGRSSNYRPPPPKPLPQLPPAMQAELDRENELVKQARLISKNLKPLNRQNYPDWFKASLPIFYMRYGNDFENRKCFAHYWKSAAYMENNPAQPGKKRLTKRARGDIRDAIKNQLKQAFHSIAPKSSRVR